MALEKLGFKEIMYKKIIVGIVAVLSLFILNYLLETFDIAFAAAVLFLVLMYSIMGMAWNILGGYGGVISFGHGVFFGLGAYIVMSLWLFYGLTPWIGIPIAGICAVILAGGLSILLRLRGHWFALATIAMIYIFLLLFQAYAPGGAAGLQAPIVPPEKQLYYLAFAGPYFYVYLALTILIIEIIFLRKVVNSHIGYYLQAIREDEDAAKALGINPFKYKLIALLISAFFWGIAGGLYTVRFRFVDPYCVFDLILISEYPVIAALLGGLYEFWGPIVGTVIFVPIAEYLRAQVVSAFPRYYGLHYFISGIIFLILIYVAPEGILGRLRERQYLKRFKIRSGNSNLKLKNRY